MMVIQEAGMSYFINFQEIWDSIILVQLVILDLFCYVWEISEVYIIAHTLWTPEHSFEVGRLMECEGFSEV